MTLDRTDTQGTKSTSNLDATSPPLLPSSLSSISLGESALRLALHQLLPHHTPSFNYRHVGLVHSSSGSNMELDVFYPTLNLAFEYQGMQHYRDCFQGGWLQQQRRDAEKREACARLDITLVHVPFWWDHGVASLGATIAHYRPDIVLATTAGATVDISSAVPIPTTQPVYEKQMKLVNVDPAAYFLKANKYHDWMDPTNL